MGVPMATADPRLQNLVEITGGDRRVIGSLVGGADAAINKSIRSLANAMSMLRSRATEIREHSQLLPSERARRLEELRPAAIAAARQHKTVLQSERQRIEALRRAATAVQAPEGLPLYRQQEDFMLVNKYLAADVGQRAAITARCVADPLASRRMSEALQRIDPAITGIEQKLLDLMRSSLYEAVNPEGARAIDMQVNMLEMAQRADDLARATIYEALPAAVAELDVPTPPVAATGDTKQQAFDGLPEAIKQDLMTGGQA